MKPGPVVWPEKPCMGCGLPMRRHPCTKWCHKCAYELTLKRTAYKKQEKLVQV